MMTNVTDNALGTEDMEKGMRPSSVSTGATILANVLLILLVFNSDGLMRWTQRLPSSPVAIWLAERAADWDALMNRPPADVMRTLRAKFRID